MNDIRKQYEKNTYTANIEERYSTTELLLPANITVAQKHTHFLA